MAYILLSRVHDILWLRHKGWSGLVWNRGRWITCSCFSVFTPGTIIGTYVSNEHDVLNVVSGAQENFRKSLVIIYILVFAVEIFSSIVLSPSFQVFRHLWKLQYDHGNMSFGCRAFHGYRSIIWDIIECERENETGMLVQNQWSRWDTKPTWHSMLHVPAYPCGVTTCSRPVWCNSLFNILRPRQNGRHFPDDTFEWNENVWIAIKSSLKFVQWRIFQHWFR